MPSLFNSKKKNTCNNRCLKIGFSLIDPIIFGKLVNLANYQKSRPFNWHNFLFVRTMIPSPNGKGGIMLYGVALLVIASITVAMVSRIAKNFQDYFLSVIVQ